ncbi:member of the major facilitator superfamily [Salix suchowensis]|nr:member of the major facilitator superfamily [Salix suchowensis]
MTLLAITSVSLALDLPKVEFSDFHVKLRRVDFPGAITLVLAVFFLLFGLDRGGNIAWDDKLTVASLSAFGALCLLFWTIEMEIAKEPFAPRRIIVNRSLIASYLVNFFGMASGLSLLFHISLWLQAVQGKSASAAGVWLLWSIGGSVTGSLGGGLIMQATGKYYYLTLGAYVALFGGSLLITLMTGLITTSFTGLAIGSGITTSLIALIANAGPKDQAIATAGTLRSALRKKLDGTDIEEVLPFNPYHMQRWSLMPFALQLIRRVRESLTYVDTLDPGTQAAVRSRTHKRCLLHFFSRLPWVHLPPSQLFSLKRSH